jgi:uncharacterized RDD family membrane protein YckC
MNYASLLQRALAQIIDYIVFCVCFFPVTYLVKGTWLMTRADHIWVIFDPICAVFLVIIFTYFIFLEWLTGCTIGKYLLNLRVQTITEKKITLKQSLIRNFGRMIDGLPCFNILGIVSIIKSPVRQRMGDKFAGTVVVLAKKHENLNKSFKMPDNF